MAAGNWFAYNEGKKYLLTADLDLNATTVRIKLIKGTAAANVSNFTRSTWASLAALTAPGATTTHNHHTPLASLAGASLDA